MNITIANTGSRSMLHGCVLAAVALIGLAPAATFAAIKTVTIDRRSEEWNPFAIVARDRTPIFRGNNTIRVVGTDSLITTASGFQLRRGSCPTTTAAGTLVATGVITDGKVSDHEGVSSLTITVAVRQTRALGTDLCGHIVYPTGARDTFTARLLSRGAVSGVSHNDPDGYVAGGTAVTFTFTGEGMNPATINTNLTPIPGLTVGTIAAPNANTTTARLTFAYCGLHQIFPMLLFDPNTPNILASDYRYHYQYTRYAYAEINVVKPCTTRPSSTQAPGPYFCVDDPDTTTDECVAYR